MRNHRIITNPVIKPLMAELQSSHFLHIGISRRGKSRAKATTPIVSNLSIREIANMPMMRYKQPSNWEESACVFSIPFSEFGFALAFKRDVVFVFERFFDGFLLRDFPPLDLVKCRPVPGIELLVVRLPVELKVFLNSFPPKVRLEDLFPRFNLMPGAILKLFRK